MKFYLFNDGLFYPHHSEPIKEWEHKLGFRAYSNNPEEAEIKVKEYFNQFVIKNNLQDHSFIQWKNDGLQTIPCFGDKRGNWLVNFCGMFREQKYMDEFMHNKEFFKEIPNHI